jgi:hypothetical protein
MHADRWGAGTRAARRGSARRRRTRRWCRWDAAARVRPLQTTCAPFGEAAHLDLDAFERGIDKAHRAAGPVLRRAHARARAPGAARCSRCRGPRSPNCGKRNSRCGANHSGLHSGSRRCAGPRDVLEVAPDEVRQHPAVVDVGAPAHERRVVRLASRSGRSARAAAAAARGSCARAAASRRRATRAARGGRWPVGRVELVDAELGAVGVAGGVDEQVAEQPIHEPGRRRVRSGSASRRRAPSS